MQSLARITLCAVLATACSRTPAAVDAAPPPPPPPSRPANVIAEVHFGHPRATVTAAGQLLNTRIPFELGLALALGIDSTILAASDTARPIDAVVLNVPQSAPDILLVLTPGPQSQFRSTLSGRYRFTRVDGLGERLESRSAAPQRGGLSCAVVGVPGPVASRVVCASRPEALMTAGRFAAYMAQSRTEDPTDALVEIDGESARRNVLPLAQAAIAELTRGLAGSAADQRRRHESAPALGDPEAIVTMLAHFGENLGNETADVRHLTLRLGVGEDGLLLEADSQLDPAGHSAIARDAVSRLHVPAGHPLASRLAVDSIGAIASRTAPGTHSSLVATVVESVIAVLGDRVPDPAAARTDLNALLAHASDEVALGVTRDDSGRPELTAVFAQDDRGSSARDALTHIASAAWLRGTHLGDATLRTTFANGVLTLQLPAIPHTNATGPATRPANAARRGAGAPAVAAADNAPPTVVISVIDDTLVVVAGSHPSATLAAMAPRRGGPPPAVFARAREASVLGGVDVGAIASNGQSHGNVEVSYAVTPSGSDLVAHGRLRITPDAVHAARDSLQSGLR